MKLKKDEVRFKILMAAKQEFFTNGYLDANMRSIATKANITPGNIYRYYASKEELLDAIVGGVNKALTTITKLESVVPSTIISNSKLLINYFINTALDYAIKNKYETIILLSKSQGSKYEHCADDFIKMTAKSIDKSSSNKNMDLAMILAETVIHGESMIIKNYIDDEEKIKSLSLDFLQTIFASYIK